ncbi:MAG: pyridoxal phosphate-dependent aminotransferase [Kistimonas sp.]|nr:pyridoxal phosphate-dependent aminotransferase [Kistimonas sp.]
MQHTASRIQAIRPSATLEVTARAAELKAAGCDVIGLGAGEPDFDTPQHIREAAVAAIEQGQTRYTHVTGTPALKQAISDKFERDNKLSYSPGQVLVSCGAKQSLFNMVMALLDPGDEVIIPAPYWVSYPEMVRITGACPVILKTGMKQNFKITPAQLRGSLSSKTRLVILNSPSNPSGMAYSAQELQALGEVLADWPRVMIATDDIYEHILWKEGGFANIATACPDLHKRVLVVNGVSKAYAMTGWRIGYAAGPEWLIRAMTKVQSQSTSNPCSVSQAAAVAALTGSQEPVQRMLKSFHQRHDLVLSRLKSIAGFEVHPVDGTFYILPNIRQAMKGLGYGTDVEFCNALLAAGVAVVPGSAFGAPGHIRISFAASKESLEQALERIAKFVGRSAESTDGNTAHS